MAINQYIKRSQYNDFLFPYADDFWRIGAGAVATQVCKELTIWLTKPFFYEIAKEKDGGEKQMRYARKAGSHTWQAVMFMIATIWGYHVLL